LLAALSLIDDPKISAPEQKATPPIAVDAAITIPAIRSRFELSNQLPTIPGLMMDAIGNGWGVAQQVARSKYLQARMLWIDCTANIERYNTEEKIVELMKQIKLAGFNTVVFDIKPISGQVVYNSRIAPRLREWRGRQLPTDFDPLAIFVRESRSTGLTLFVSLNAFSEGHRDFRVGPGYDKLAQQTVLYEPRFLLTSPSGKGMVLSQDFNKSSTDENVLSGFNDRSKVPASTPGNVAITLDRQGVVKEVFENGGNGRTPVPPKDGSVIVGTGAGAQFLRENSLIGLRMTLESQTEYVPISQRPEQQVPLMMNPSNPDVQAYALSIVQELLRNYDLDGIIYDDRLRYAGLNADFSQQTQLAFEQYVGRRVAWPDDIFRFTMNPSLNRGIAIGQYYDAWMNWRSLVIRNFLAMIRRNIKQIRPRAQFGLYAGSWYGEYQRYGNNWAAPDADAGFWFLTPEYQKTGLAPLLDFFVAGCYYPVASIPQALSAGTPPGMTVESAGQLANRMVRDQTWTYAGISLADFKGNPDGLKDALQAAVGATQGIMVFDLSHDIEPMWPVFRQAFGDPRRAPHSEPGLLAEVRRKRAQNDKAGVKEPPVIISSGAAGVGF
jgi:hypothetical protein